MPTYRDLLVWQRSMDLVVDIYALTRALPLEERFGLATQMRRAAVSVPTNLAEGHSRRTRPAYLHHISIAIGSQAEIETLLEVCRRLELTDRASVEAIAVAASEVGRMLYGLFRSLDDPRS